jgi:hypothetical protein
MTYCLVLDIPGPPELFRAVHTELSRYPTYDLLVHVARPVDGGVQVVEVWTSAEAFGTWMQECGGPALGALAAAGWTLPEVTPTPFEPAGLIVPAAGIAV